jgi:hypothetical protein
LEWGADSIFARVSSHAAWIKKTMEENGEQVEK